VTTRRRCAVLFVVVLLFLAIVVSLYPRQATCQPGLDTVDLGQKERIAVQRAVDQIVVKLRHYYAIGEYDKVLEECDNLDKIDPKNAIGSYYRSLATKRKEERATEREIGPAMPSETTPSAATARRGGEVVVPTATPAQSRVEAAVQPPSQPSPGAGRIRELLSSALPIARYAIIVLAAAAVLLIAMVGVRKIAGRKPRVARAPKAPRPKKSKPAKEAIPEPETQELSSLTTDLFSFEKSGEGLSLDTSLPMAATTQEEAVAEPLEEPKEEETAVTGGTTEESAFTTAPAGEEVSAEDEVSMSQFLGLDERTIGGKEPALEEKFASLNSDIFEQSVEKHEAVESKGAEEEISATGAEAEVVSSGSSIETPLDIEAEATPLSVGEETSFGGAGEAGESTEEKVDELPISSLDNELFGEPAVAEKPKTPAPPAEELSKLKKTAYDEDFEKLMFAGGSEDETIVSKSTMEDETLVAPLTSGKSDKGKVIRLDSNTDDEERAPSGFDTSDTIMLMPDEIEQSVSKEEKAKGTRLPEETVREEPAAARVGTGSPASEEEQVNIEFEELALKDTGTPKESEVSASGISGGAGKGGTLEERNEALFRDQYRKGCKAYEEGDWKKAVHFFTVASALKPNMQEVKERLRIAKAERQRTEKE
jgi:hypothetical protein